MIYCYKLLLPLILILCLTQLAVAQRTFQLGFKGGISTYDLGVDETLTIFNSDEEDKLILGVEDARYGFHGGIVLQLNVAAFILQPEVVFNSNSVNYSVDNVMTTDGDQVFKEKYHNLDIPVLLGLRAGPLRVVAGPVGHYYLSSSSELFEFEEYDQKFEELTYGWQAGMGLDILNIMIDIRYEGNFAPFGDHIVFYGRSYEFSTNPARLLASIALAIR